MSPRRKSVRKRAKDLIAPHPEPIQEESSVREAGEEMRTLRVDKFPVAAGDRLVGTVEGKFPERKAARYGHDPSTTLVGETMTHRTIFCYEHQSIGEARKIMKDNGLQHLPVVDGDLRIIGIVALKELETPAR